MKTETKYIIKKTAIVFCLVFLCLGIVRAKGQSYNLTTYNTTSGLPGNQINDLMQDRHGRLWVATMNGVAIFNGEQFTRFDKNAPESTNPVKTIFEDSKGNIWMGMLRGGICKFNAAGKSYYKLPDGLVGDDIYDITEDKQGQLWIGTATGLSRYNGSRFSNYTVFRGLVNDHVNALKYDSKGRLWIATMGGVSMYDGNRFINYTTSNGLSSNICLSVHEDSKGVIRVGTYAGICELVNNRFKPADGLAMFAGERIEGFIGNDVQSMSVATYNNGMVAIKKDGAIRISMEQGLPSNIVKSVLVDREGIYWIGTWSGLCKWTNEKFSYFTHEDGLANNNLISIASDSKGRMFFGTLTGGLSYLDNGKLYSIGNESGLLGLTIWSLFVEADDKVWMGTETGVALWDPQTKKLQIPYPELNYLTVYAITRQPSGELLLGTDDGLVLISKNGTSKLLGKEDGLQDIKVRSLSADASGKIWIGTTKGLYTKMGNEISKYGPSIGIGEVQINAIGTGKNGAKLISTLGQGCFVVERDGATKVLDEKRGISSNDCRFALHDSQNRLWIGTSNGVEVATINSDGKIDTDKILHFNASRGFTGSETNAISEDLYGNIWFSTVNGAIKFPKTASLPAAVLPTLRISSMNLLLKDTDWKNRKIKVDPYTGLPAELILPYNNNHVTFNFEGAFLSAPEEVEYQYILENFDEKWSPASARPFAIYSNLNAGTYTFKVKCSTNGRDWTNPVIYSFTIKPPFWKTNFFYILYVITAAVIVFAFSKFRTRNLEKKRNILQSLVDERTQELNEKNQELEKLSIVASETDNSVLIFDALGSVEWVNEGFTKLTGFSLDEIVQLHGKTLTSFTFNPDAIQFLEDCVAKQQSGTFESSIRCKDGQKKWVSHTLTPVFGDDGLLQKTIVIATDITLRKNMEERIRESLDEKGLLLREIHHRVKNNLQIIISLFNLQSHYVEDKKAFVALKEGQDRIKSMALIHERFYQNDGLSKIDFDDYIKRLVENLLMSFNIAPGRIKSTIEADRISLDIDTAVPCGLIINELVSNALKHAFVPEKEGHLYVSLKYMDSKQVRLTVKDDGIGLPKGFDVAKYDSLGMQLINALSNQLDGKLTTLVDNGTTFHLDFAVPSNG